MSDPAGRQLGLLWGVVALLLVLLSPLAPTLASGLWSCLFKGATGIPCPSCGTARAALALAAFDPSTALVRYPLQTLAWVLFLVGGLAAGSMALRGRPLPSLPDLPSWWRIAFLGAVLLNWAYSIATGV